MDIRLHLNCETHEFRLELSDKAFEAMRPEHQSRVEFIAQILAGHHPEKTSSSRFYHMLEILRSLEQAFFKKQTRIKYGLEEPDKLEFKIQVNDTKTYKNGETIYIPNQEETLTLKLLQNEDVVVDNQINWTYGKYGLQTQESILKLEISELQEDKSTVILEYGGMQITVSVEVNMSSPEQKLQFSEHDFIDNFDASVTTTQKQNFVKNINKLASYPQHYFLVEQLIKNKVIIKHDPKLSGDAGSFNYVTNTIDLNLDNSEYAVAYAEEPFHAYQYAYYGKDYYEKLRVSTFLEVEARLYRGYMIAKHTEPKYRGQNEIQKGKVIHHLVTNVPLRQQIEKHIDGIRTMGSFGAYSSAKVHNSVLFLQKPLLNEGYTYVTVYNSTTKTWSKQKRKIFNTNLSTFQAELTEIGKGLQGLSAWEAVSSK